MNILLYLLSFDVFFIFDFLLILKNQVRCPRHKYELSGLSVQDNELVVIIFVFLLSVFLYFL